MSNVTHSDVLTGNYRKYTSANPLKQFFIRRFLLTVANAVAPLRSENLLDVGCGEGFVLSYLAQRGIGGSRTGVDISESALRVGLTLYPDLRFIKGNAYHLPFPDNTFDIVLCLEVLEHLEKPEAALREALRVSRSHCVVSVPHEPLFTLANIVSLNHWRTFGFEPEHVNFWTRRSFKCFVQTHGDIEKTINSFPWVLAVVKKRTYGNTHDRHSDGKVQTSALA